MCSVKPVHYKMKFYHCFLFYHSQYPGSADGSSVAVKVRPHHTCTCTVVSSQCVVGRAGAVEAVV